MGLIYVNPEGPEGNPDPLAAAHDIRETFSRMAMNDEETVALIAGGHTFGKTHGAADPEHTSAPSPRPPRLEQLGLGWQNSFGSGKGADAITSGLEVTWTRRPTAVEQPLLRDPLRLRVGAAPRARPAPTSGCPRTVRRASIPARARRRRKRIAPNMLTTDLALRIDPVYEQISRRFLENPEEFADAFARAWFKLTHRDMGPVARYLGPEVPERGAALAGPDPGGDRRDRHGRRDVADAQGSRSPTPASRSRQLVSTAWASASSFRGSDKRGGANGGRIRLEPQSGWEVNDPAAAGQRARARSRASRSRSTPGGHQVSLADLSCSRAASASSRRRPRPASPSRCRSPRVAATPPRSRPTSSRSPGSSRKADGFRNYAAARAPSCRRSTSSSTRPTCSTSAPPR